MHLYTKQCSILIVNFALETRQQRQHYHNFELLLLLVSFIDSHGDSLTHLVFHRYEELVFYVDEFLGFRDKLYVGVVNRLLLIALFDAKTPRRCTPKYLVTLAASGLACLTEHQQLFNNGLSLPKRIKAHAFKFLQLSAKLCVDVLV